MASGEKPRVLFICTGNSCRSQIAEALLRHRGGDRYEADSAGLDPKGVHPRTIQVLDELGIDTNPLHSKHIKEFLGKVAVRYAIVVCDKAQNSCPQVYPFAPHNLFWPFEDPAAFQGNEEETLNEFRRVRDEIDQTIQTWLREERSS